MNLGILLSSPAIGLQTGISVPTFSVGARDPDSGSHSFIVSSEPSSPHSIITVSAICFCLLVMSLLFMPYAFKFLES